MRRSFGKRAAVAAAVSVVTILAALSPAVAFRPSSACPAGFQPVGSERSRSTSRAATGLQDIDATDARGERLCIADNHPESLLEIGARDRQLEAAALAPLSAADAEGLFRASLEERAALSSPFPPVAGSTGTWTPYGKGPLISNDERFDSVNGGGFVELNGRIDSFDYDPVKKRLFASLGTGGVWMSTNLGDSWTSVGDRLPSQIVGAVAWSQAFGGTLIVVGGEPLMAGLARVGLGAFYTRDLGKTWKQAKGIPDGALGFTAAVDPLNPKIVYAATSKGLYRSDNAGVTYKNVALPTGDCAGKIDNKACLLANIVTDVVVQTPDKFGNKGGRVLAVVGYRGGQRPFPQDPSIIESPNNGIYRSDTGMVGSFQKLSATGFAPQHRIGRTEFGVASGPDQNHDYVYALVQDAILLQGGTPTVDAPEDLWTGLNNTTLNGVYVSADFGETWAVMGDTLTIAENPATGSALAGTGQALFFGPGVQAWYNEWIKPDPTRQDANGVPTRLLFGLEEVWQNELTTQPQNGRSAFKVIGRYYADGSCLLLLSGLPGCPTGRPAVSETTTHPDQQDAIFIPDGSGGVTLIVGNDGGAYRQQVAAGEEFDNTKWGIGKNRGFNTLLPYHVRAAKDGTAWFGLQDNGSGKIEAGTRKQVMTFGGDGFYVAVDPDNSNIAWSETTFGDMRVTTDGGVTWTGQQPPITGGQFSNPFVMDPLDAKHLLTSGRQVVETTDGPETCTVIKIGDLAQQTTSCTWKEVYNLGTHSKPGDGAAEASGTDPANTMSAVDLVGTAAYVGFCGPCDIISTKVPYKMGLATNVRASGAPAEKATPEGWHLAAARGLPNRTITNIAIDPKNPKTVYVTMGGYAGRTWRGPGTFGDKNTKIGRGHVFRSTNAGESFVDISGRLPNAPANWITIRGNQLVVATDVGVFLSSDTRGTLWALLNKGLPVVPVVSVQVMPGDKNSLLIATFGRGVYQYKFPVTAAKKTPTVKGVKQALAATGVGDPMTGVVLLAMASALMLRLQRRREV